MKKGYAILFGVVLIIMSLTAPAFSTSDITIVVNGQKIVSDVPPVIVDGRTLVPIRVVAEALDFEVSWDSEFEIAT
jgi:hypothetical protein